MTKLRNSIVNLVGMCFLSGIDASTASGDNVFADVYKNTRGMDSSEIPESTNSVEMDYDLMSGINRGRGSPIDAEGDVVSQQTAFTASYNNGLGASTVSSEPVEPLPKAVATPRLEDTIHFGHASCIEETEDLLAAYEDIRLELSAIDQQYLENASIENVCTKDGEVSNCNFDFRNYPSNLESVCNNRGGNFYVTEHSIQCHNPSKMESLYYQFDHYPSCCSESCERNDRNDLLTGRIDSITEAMSEFLEMSCFADFDILRHANETISFLDSAGSTTAQRSIQELQILLGALPMLLINYLV